MFFKTSLITVDEDKRNFEALVNILKLREYDFLDYRLCPLKLKLQKRPLCLDFFHVRSSIELLHCRNSKFDVDFVDFNRKIDNLTEKVYLVYILFV